VLDPLSANKMIVNKMIKKRCASAGLGAALYRTHGLHSGYLTEAARHQSDA